MKVVVLAGGISTERSISIVSGKGVCAALREKGHQALLIDVFLPVSEQDLQNGFSTSYDLDKAVQYIAAFDSQVEELKQSRAGFFGEHVLEICKEADIVFLALHGEDGENGKIQATFDLMGIRYTGSGHLGSAMAMDKSITKTILEAAGVPTPKGVRLVQGAYSTSPAVYGMSFPLVVKPCCGGSSVGVYIVDTQTAYEEALTNAFAYEDEIIVETYISGREFSVGIVEDTAYPIIEVEVKEGFYDYTNKYKAGAAIETCPALLNEAQTSQMQEHALQGFKALALEGYARLDFMLDSEGHMYCLEANTLPGMTPTSLLPQEAQVLGIAYPQLCELLIEVSMKKYK
ncbi:MAG: D-alanine--D-alanine ligase [Lachnospiraceae bacterium]